jgi:hypothetical protein
MIIPRKAWNGTKARFARQIWCVSWGMPFWRLCREFGKGSAESFAKAKTMSHNPHTDEQEQAPSLSDEAQKQIGRKLRLLYEQLEAEPIPDKFVDLLRELAEKESKPR